QGFAGAPRRARQARRGQRASEELRAPDSGGRAAGDLQSTGSSALRGVRPRRSSIHQPGAGPVHSAQHRRGARRYARGRVFRARRDGIHRPVSAGRLRQARRVRILVVDDNHDTADALAWLLQSIGHEARTAYDGPSALLAVERHSPEVIIQDLGMPGMSGYEIARRMRKLSAARRATLVALTGDARADAWRTAREA